MGCKEGKHTRDSRFDKLQTPRDYCTISQLDDDPLREAHILLLMGLRLHGGGVVGCLAIVLLRLRGSTVETSLLGLAINHLLLRLNSNVGNASVLLGGVVVVLHGIAVLINGRPSGDGSSALLRLVLLPEVEEGPHAEEEADGTHTVEDVVNHEEVGGIVTHSSESILECLQ